jgi:PA14 domain
MWFRKAGAVVGVIATCGFTMLIGSVGPEGLHLDKLAGRVGIDLTQPKPVDPIAGDRLTRDVWANTFGRKVSDIPVDQAPTDTGLVGRFETPVNAAERYGQRLRGYVTAPATGDYTFWVSGDDEAELWLSTSADPKDKVKIAWNDDWTPPRVWDWFSTQKSKPVSLVATQRYYVEALMKEDRGDDGLAVGWSRPGESTDRPSEVIPGDVLSPM